MGRLDDFVMAIGAGLKQGMADVTRAAIADVGNAYQQILTQDASVGPGQGPPGTMTESTYEMERAQNPPVLESDPARGPEPER
jgi:hypothetical protein